MSERLKHFTTLCSTLLLDPRAFFKTYVTEKDQRPYYWVVMFLVIVVPACFSEGRIYSQRSTDIQDLVDSVLAMCHIHDIPNLWVLYGLVQMLLSVLIYRLIGYFLKFFVFCAGGKVTVRQARTIVGYSLAVSMAVVAIGVLVMTPLLLWNSPSKIQIAIFCLLFLNILSWYAMYKQMYTQYCGIVVLTGAPPKRVITIFILFPVLAVLAAMLLGTILYVIS